MSNSDRYFESLDPDAKEQYKRNCMSLLNLTGDNGPYNDKASKNSVQLPGCGLLQNLSLFCY